MKSYAIIENNVVVNVVVANDEFAISQGWVEITQNAGVGWDYVDGIFSNTKKEIEGETAKIKSDIAALEVSVTPRRQREAILAIDTTWLADVELQIGQLRQQLAEL
jgi:hypothetical protein